MQQPDLSCVEIAVTKPKSKVAKALVEMGLSVTVVTDDEGPVERYILSPRVAVERRTASGFLRGIQDKTLFTSAIFLHEHFAVAALIVEGEVDYGYSAFDPQAVRGALSSMMLLYGVSVLATPDADETAAVIAMMARQEQLGIPEISLVPKRKAVDLSDMQRRVVEMLPGCGMVMARELLQHFGSVRRVVNATPEELRAMRGLGAKKVAEIASVLGADYESVDTERNVEDAIEADPTLLFDEPVQLVARQHYILSDEHGRQFLDLVFFDPDANELVLVELKRGRIMHADAGQLRRYLDNAERSELLRGFLGRGAGLRGVLAGTEPNAPEIKDADIEVRQVDAARVIEVLAVLRARRMELSTAGGAPNS